LCVRTLITGGAGFIGSHLCERFLAEGHEVVAVDNLITGDLANLDRLRTNPRFRFIGHDVSHPLWVKDKLDNVLHFASPASPVDYLDHPIPTLKVGALGTHNTLGLAKAHDARYLLASTSEVYGDPLEHPQTESYWGNVNPVGVRGCYDEAKRFAESIVMAYAPGPRREHAHRAHLQQRPGGPNRRRVRRGGNAPRTGRGVGRSHSPRPRQRCVLVPAFDPRTLRMELKPALALTEHEPRNDAFEISLRYGRNLKVTGDHSVFVEGADGRPVPKFARELQPGDRVAIPARLPVVERDRTEIDVAAEFAARGVDDAWDWAVRHPTSPGRSRNGARR